MTGDVVRDFLEPLARLGFRPGAGEDLAEIAGHLTRVRPRATAEHLRRAADALAATRRSKVLPAVGLLVAAIDTAAATGATLEAVGVARSVVREAPVVTRCRRFVEAYEASDETERARIEAAEPGHYALARRVLDAEQRIRSASDDVAA